MMPPILHIPNVDVDEVADNSIKPAPTSVAVFVGWSMTGPVDQSVRVSSVEEFERTFGPLHSASLLGYAVGHFFANGGRDAHIVRLESPHGGPLKPDEADFAEAMDFDRRTSKGLHLIKAIPDFDLLAVPGYSDPSGIVKLLDMCAERHALLIADADQHATARSVMEFAAALRGTSAANGALYFPWVYAADAFSAGGTRAFPPSGFVTGLIARCDEHRGIWKAPAGTDAILVGAKGVHLKLSDADQMPLNSVGVNCIREFPARGVVVWGSRTLCGVDGDQSGRKYIPVRRTMLYIERSIEAWLKRVVFEPNLPSVWDRIRLEVEKFLHGLFRQGAFQGVSPREAYFVKCDSETNTPADIDANLVNVLVGVAMLRSGEFVLMKFQQATRSVG